MGCRFLTRASHFLIHRDCFRGDLSQESGDFLWIKWTTGFIFPLDLEKGDWAGGSCLGIAEVNVKTVYKIRTAESKAKIDGEKLRSASNDWDLNLAVSEAAAIWLFSYLNQDISFLEKVFLSFVVQWNFDVPKVQQLLNVKIWAQNVQCCFDKSQVVLKSFLKLSTHSKLGNLENRQFYTLF